MLRAVLKDQETAQCDFFHSLGCGEPKVQFHFDEVFREKKVRAVNEQQLVKQDS
jgi:hypothetical protein